MLCSWGFHKVFFPFFFNFFISTWYLEPREEENPKSCHQEDPLSLSEIFFSSSAKPCFFFPVFGTFPNVTFFGSLQHSPAPSTIADRYSSPSFLTSNPIASIVSSYVAHPRWSHRSLTIHAASCAFAICGSPAIHRCFLPACHSVRCYLRLPLLRWTCLVILYLDLPFFLSVWPLVWHTIFWIFVFATVCKPWLLTCLPPIPRTSWRLILQLSLAMLVYLSPLKT